MKHTMTPRLPPLHNRTLTGNILDASLGLMNTPQLPHPQPPHLPHPPTHVNRDIATTISVPVPMETTTAAEDSTSQDQKPEPEESQRSVMEGAPGSHDNKEIAQSTTKSSDVQGKPEELSKTCSSVRLLTDPVPLRLSGSDESLPPVISPNNIMTSVSAAGALPPAILMKDDVGTNAEQFSTIIASPSLQLPGSTTTTTTVNSHSLPISGHPIPVSDQPLPVDVRIEDSPFESTPLSLSTVGDVLGESSPLPQRGLNSTFIKSSPTTSVGESADLHQQATLTDACQQDKVRTRTEHSYAKVEPQNSDDRQPPQSGEESSPRVNEDQTSRDIPPREVPSQEQQTVGEAGTSIQEGVLMANEEQNQDTEEHVSTTSDSNKVNGDNSVIIDKRLDGFVDHSTMIVEGEESRMSIDNLVPDPEGAMEVLHEHTDMVPTIIEDQVLEVAMIEPKSDVPMPVEYTVVTQQDEPPPPLPPQQEAKPVEEDVPIQNPDADMVLEDGNESGESITIGCEVTASTMELTDVTEFSGGSSATTTAERPRVPDLAVAEDISCETVIITTSAMNSLSTGYSTPSGEESDGTLSSVEEKQRRRGEGGGRGKERVGEGGGGEMGRVAIAVGGGREGKNSEIVANHNDGTESDEIFEDILKQIESAPYELRISNIVLAQLSRAVSKSPPNPAKKRKRRSASKKWTRTKSRKSNTPRKN